MTLKLDKLKKQVKLQALKLKKERTELGKLPKVGQLWTSDIKNNEIPEFLLLVLEELGDETFNCAPYFTYLEKAGPQDMFIPSPFTGVDAVVSFELEFSANIDALVKPVYQIAPDKMKLILGAQKAISIGNNNGSFSYGIDYLDQHDTRLEYHAQLLDEIQILQKSLIKNVLGEEKVESNIREYNFQRFDYPLSAAAADDTDVVINRVVMFDTLEPLEASCVIDNQNDDIYDLTWRFHSEPRQNELTAAIFDDGEFLIEVDVIDEENGNYSMFVEDLKLSSGDVSNIQIQVGCK